MHCRSAVRACVGSSKIGMTTGAWELARRLGSSPGRQPVVDAFDVKVHAADLNVGEMVAVLALNGTVVLIENRARERMQAAGLERGFGCHRELFHIVRHV